MRSMTFQVDDQSTGSAIPAVVVTITENADGSLSFTLSVVGGYTGDLRGFFFDLADESLLETLTATAPSGMTEFRKGDDNVVDLGNGANMQGLVGSDGGYDAGIEIGTAGIGKDDYQSFSFRLSAAGGLSLDDFAGVDFGVRLTSVGEAGGSRTGSVKMLEHTTSAIDAIDDANSVTEDATPNSVAGNVLDNDQNLGTTRSVTPAVIEGTYGTLLLNADGSYTYTLNNAAVQFLAVGETRTESFSYTATSSDEAASSSTDSATLTITITGANDAPVITAAVSAGAVAEFAEDSPAETLGSHSTSGSVNFEDVDLSDVHGVSVTPASSGYLGTLTAQVTDDSTGDGEGQVSWTYEVSDAAIEHLGLGDSVTQTYTIAVNDGHGGSDTQDVTITINGANDAPEIVAGDTEGQVFEDGSRRASGALTAVDIDQDSELTWSVTGSGPMTPWANYRFLIDNLNVVRTGLPSFNDDFGNGAPPPSGTTFGYFTFGTFQEFGSRVIMDGSLGAASTISGITAISHLATLNTDTGPDVTQGLKKEQQFRVEARYDLVMPADVLGTYGLRLGDGANDLVEIDVRRLADDTVAVVLREANVAGTVPVTLATIPLQPAAGDNQIVLRLEHAANSNLISASFDLLNGGVPTQTQTFAVTPDIFSDENWTRVQFNGLAPAMVQNGVYGTLSVGSDGHWTYALNNRAANVQALAQGDHVTDTFTVRVTDEHGASDTQTVTVDVFGSNDAPIITAGDVNGFVQEDGTTGFTRQFTASDADQLQSLPLHWSVGPQTQVPVPGVPNSFFVFGYSSNYHFSADQLTVERNGSTIFSDGFGDGVPPPSAPNFSNGTTGNYLTNGAGFIEEGGRLVLDGSRAVSARGIGNPDLVVGHIAVLNTNADGADLTRGLKSDDDFTIEARFDLVTPGASQGYGLSLTDNTTNGLPPDQLGDDSVNLFVRADAAGNLSVQFNRFDIPSDAVTPYGSFGFTREAGEDQIELRLIHDADQRGVLHAEFDLIGGVNGTRTLKFDDLHITGRIFGTNTPGYEGDDEEWTRAQLTAFGFDSFDADSDPASHQGVYGSLSVTQNGQWTYSLDNASANVQELAQFQFAQDNFSVRVVDEYGMSSFRPVFISVQGSNDPVVAAGGDTSGAVKEDETLTASGILRFTDVDLIDTHSAFFAPGGVYGSFTLEPVVRSPLTSEISVRWNYQLRNDMVQFLAEGETRSEMFLVTVQDNVFPFPTSATQEVTVTIIGVNDGNSAPVGADDFFPTNEDVAVGGVVTATDADGDPLSFGLAEPAQHGTAVVNPDGSFTYTPAANYSGGDSFQFIVTDGHGGQDVKTVSLDVFAVADTPTLAVPESGAGEFAINHVQIVSAPRIAALDDGGYVVTWWAYGDSPDVFAQRFDASGQPDAIYQVSEPDVAGQVDQQQAVIELPNGNLAFVWRSVDNGGPEEAFGRVFDANGNPLGGEFSLASPGSYSFWPQLAPHGDGFVATWTEFLGSFHDVFGRLFDADGQALGEPYQISPDNSTGFGFDFYNPVAELSDGGYVVLFREDGGMFGGSVVAGQRFDAANQRVGDPFLVASGSGSSVDWPDVAALPDGGFVATWLRYDQDGFDTDVYAQRFAANGSPVGGVITVSADLPGVLFQNDTQPAIAAGPDGSFVIVWDTETVYGTEDQILARRFSADGAPLGGIMTLSEDGQPHRESNPDVASVGDGSFAVVWDTAVWVDFNSVSHTFVAGRVITPGAGITTDEDVPVELDIAAALTDTDDSETLSVTISGVPLGATLSAGSDQGNGTWILAPWQPGLTLTLTPAPDSDEDIELTVTATSTEDANGDQASITKSFIITVNPVDDAPNAPPIAVADSNLGDPNNPNDDDLVIESGTVFGPPFPDMFASGNVLLNDFDPDADPGLPGLLVVDVEGSTGVAFFDVQGTYGTLSMYADGTWSYNLLDLDPDTDALRAGEAAFDEFTYTVQDSGGATATTTLTVAITGSNDFPTFAPGGNTGDVTEDSGDSVAEGQLVGIDPDQGASLRYQLNGATAFTADYLFGIDHFTLTRDRGLPLDTGPVAILNDDFNNGVPPPTDGFFINGNAAYLTNGTFSEAGGRAIMDGDSAAPTFSFGAPGPVVGHSALVLTNTGADLTAGLRITHSFDVMARFDAVLPEHVGQAYGISLTDQRMGFGGDDHIQLLVRRDADNVVRVVLREGDASVFPNTVTPLGSIELTGVGEGDQIVLHLTHDPAQPGTIVGSFQVLGLTPWSHTFTGTGQVFGTETPGFAADDENFTRPSILATSPAQTSLRTGIFGTVAFEVDSGEWRYVLNNSDLDTQRLAQGASAFDTFEALVIDEFNTASFGNISVEVHGTNDAPVAAADTATTTENQAISVNVLANDTDIDNGAVLTVLSASAPAGHGSASIVGNQVRFDPGTDFDHLAPGETEVVSIAYAMRDEHGATSQSTVDITVTGEAEPPAADGTVFEDGGRVASGQQTTPPGLDPATTTWSDDLVDVEVNPDYRFLIDNLNIRRGATPATQTQYFNDDFGDGNPPASAPGPVNETTPTFVGYSLNGSFLEPFGLGRAVLDGPRAVVVDGIGTPETRYSTSARLNTDNSPDLSRGLKIDDAFTVEGRFDLVTTLEPNQRYGIRLTDAGRNNPDGSPVPATDIVELTLSRSDTGVLRVQLRELDAAADTSITLQNITLPPIGGDPQTNQIIFRLSHDPASPGLVNASFTLTGSTTPQTFNFTAQGHIFGVGTPGDASDDEVWTRAEFRATSGAGLQNGDYGMLEGNPQGQWTYQLNNALPAVQQLKQGEQVFDSFEVLASDGAGNSATQVINIAVKGTNDTPVITTGPTNAIVVENGGALQQFTGHLSASDVDHDASLTWSLSRSFSGYSANYDFTADDFTVVRNGQVIFLDTFTSPAPPAPPAPPPSAPNFANGTFANYLTTGVFSEDLAGDGRLHLHGSQARALSGTGTDDLRVGHIATLATNIDPADLTRGLKIDDDFSVHARFDLASLPLQGQAFGLSLVDATFGGIPPDQLPQDQPLLLVTRDSANNLVVVFSTANGVTDTVHEYARTPLLLGAADTQIVLRLDHTHDTGILQASYELRDAGNAVTGGDELGAPGYVFGRGTADPADDEVWTRPSILAFAPGDDASTTSLAGFFGTFSVNNSGDWTYALNPGNPLSAGQEFSDFASVRATDEHGASTFRQISVNIVGTGDEPVFGPLVLFGTPNHDVLLGSPQGDTLRGAGGPDTLVGFGGRDEFQFTDFNVPNFQGPDTIVDFQSGPGGDVLNIADVIDFVPGGTAANFVRFLEANGATQLQINQDGIGTDFLSVATLQGVTGALLNDYIANNNLVLF